MRGTEQPWNTHGGGRPIPALCCTALFLRPVIMSSQIDAINLVAMRNQDVVEEYALSETLLPHEQQAIDSVADEVRGQPILDIGVGAGRTVGALTQVSSDYLGIDYSAEMVAACRAR